MENRVCESDDRGDSELAPWERQSPDWRVGPCGRARRANREIGVPGRGLRSWSGFLALGIFPALPHFALSAAPEPPLVVLRPISPALSTFRGTSVTLEETTVTIDLPNMKKQARSEAVLYLPDGWKDTVTTAGPTAGAVPVTVHFHGAPWYAAAEHARRGARHPLVAISSGEGSSMYSGPFVREPGRLSRLLVRAAEAMTSRVASPTRFEPVEFQSFSAGYGAVRELLKQDEWQRRVTRLVLADSLYGSLTTDTATGRQMPDPVQLAPFIRFARAAAGGPNDGAPTKRFVTAHTAIRVNYASTADTADALLAAIAEPRVAVAPGSHPAAPADGSTTFPLTSRGGRGGFAVWGYAGATPEAHMAVARTMADFHRALDQCR